MPNLLSSTPSGNSTFFLLGPVVAKQSLGGASAWGAILGAQAAGLVLGGLVALRLRPNRPLLLGLLSAATMLLPLLALAAGLPLAVVMLACLLEGVGIEQFNVQWVTTVQREVPAGRVSTMFAYDSLGSLALVPLAYATAGSVAAAIGIEATLWGAIMLITVLFGVVLLVRDVRAVTASESS